MPGGLTIILLTEDAERLRGALLVAMTHRAMGGTARLFLQLDAARLLAPPITGARDEDHVRSGFPSLAALIDDALEDDIAITVCQSGLALAGLAADDLDPRIEAGGLTSSLAAMAPTDRLVLA